VFDFMGSFDSYWTSSVVPDVYETTYAVNFSDGSFNISGANSDYVTCVTSSEQVVKPTGDAGIYPPGRYTTSGMQVTDNVTGLKWLQGQGQGTFAFAQTACPSGWRLPSIKELATLFDTAQSFGSGSIYDDQVFVANTQTSDHGF